MNTSQRRGSIQALVLQRLEERLGRVAERLDIRVRVTIGQADARESRVLDRIARKNRESFTVLIVVFRDRRIDRNVLAQQDGLLSGLIEIVTALKYGKAAGNRPVEEIRLRETKRESLLDRAELRGKRQPFAQTQKVVGLICQPDERS